MMGNQGVELHLHIASEYNICYIVLESLLHTYPGAASIQGQRPKGKKLVRTTFRIINLRAYEIQNYCAT